MTDNRREILMSQVIRGDGPEDDKFLVRIRLGFNWHTYRLMGPYDISAMQKEYDYLPGRWMRTATVTAINEVVAIDINGKSYKVERIPREPEF